MLDKRKGIVTENEIRESGFVVLDAVAVEGSVWITPTLEEKQGIEDSRNRLLGIIRTIEHERTIMGMSPHFLSIGRKTASKSEE